MEIAEPHAPLCQCLEDWRSYLAAKGLHVGKTQVVDDNQQDVGTLMALWGACHSALPETTEGIRDKRLLEGVGFTPPLMQATLGWGQRSRPMEIGSFGPVHVTWMDALARIGTSLILSLVLGLERYVNKKPIDFRPFAIIALASCVLTLSITEFAYQVDDPQLSIDPAKVVSGILTGIGFIGAGALFREDHTLQGAGSAASIWAAGAVGITCGFGFLWLAGLLSLAVVLLFVISRPFTTNYAIRVDDEEGGGRR
jgi:putative Mg2+ transporter-C (MgtC) family protein